MLDRVLVGAAVALRSSPRVYAVHLALSGRLKPGLLPSSDTALHVTGYPRSGNTFAAGVLSRVFPSVSMVTHVHAIASIKLARKHEIPTIVLVRDPQDAIASWALRSSPTRWRSDTLLSAALEYTAYHRFVLDMIDELFVLRFSQLTETPSVLLSAVHAVLPSLPIEIAESDFHSVATQVVEHLRSDTRPAGQNCWQSEEKEALKAEIRKRLGTLPEYVDARARYEGILAKRNPVEPWW